jgi:hypothetical protein
LNAHSKNASFCDNEPELAKIAMPPQGHLNWPCCSNRLQEQEPSNSTGPPTSPNPFSLAAAVRSKNLQLPFRINSESATQQHVARGLSNIFATLKLNRLAWVGCGLTVRFHRLSTKEGARPNLNSDGSIVGSGESNFKHGTGKAVSASCTASCTAMATNTDGRVSSENRITVFSITSCRHCRAAKALLGTKGVAYTNINLTDYPEKRAGMVAV